MIKTQSKIQNHFLGRMQIAAFTTVQLFYNTNKHLPQFSSSELSPQSFSPSQMKAGRAQSPVPH